MCQCRQCRNVIEHAQLSPQLGCTTCSKLIAIIEGLGDYAQAVVHDQLRQWERPRNMQPPPQVFQGCEVCGVLLWAIRQVGRPLVDLIYWKINVRFGNGPLPERIYLQLRAQLCTGGIPSQPPRPAPNLGFCLSTGGPAIANVHGVRFQE